MSATSTSTIVLENLRPPPQLRQTSRAKTPDLPGPEDPILQASREADSAVPDGGYGWVVVGGCATIAWWVVGTTYAWGVIQGALVEDGVSSPAVLSFVGSLAASMIAALAIVNSRVMRTLGPRWTGVLSILLVGISEFSSSFAVKNIRLLFASSGALMGLGMR
jgi:hypothetical protein